MESEPLLSEFPPSPSASNNNPRVIPTSPRLPLYRRNPFISSSSSFASPPNFPSSLLCPLPEHDEISIPIPPSSPTSFKDLLIFGPSPSSSEPPSPLPTTTTTTTTTTTNDDDPNDDDPSSSSSFSFYSSSWLPKSNLHRSRTAPAMAALNNPSLNDPSSHNNNSNNPLSSSPPLRPSIVRQSILLLSAYLGFGVVIYSLFTAHFASSPTHPIVDAVYFCIVTMCTIGYGDITPVTPFSKLFSILFVLFGFGFLDILLSSMVSYVLDLQESLLLSSLSRRRLLQRHHHHHHHHHRPPHNYLVDVKKGRMRIRMKVALALSVVVLCIGLGTAVLRFVEALGWLDAFYLAVMSVTTVGYGDRAFKTLAGRVFASLWLLVSTLAVARAFLYLAEARIDKRHRKMAKWVLSRDMTVSEFLAADIDNNGFVSKSEFVIYKLKEMGKISEKDILQICDQFDRLDTGRCGKITLADLIESHHH